MVTHVMTAEAEPTITADESAIFRKLQSRPPQSPLWRVAAPIAIVAALAAGGAAYFESQHANVPTPSAALNPAPRAATPLAQEVTPTPIAPPTSAPTMPAAVKPAPAKLARAQIAPRVTPRAVAHKSARPAAGAGEDVNAYAPAAQAPAQTSPTQPVAPPAPPVSAAPVIPPPTVQAPPSNPPPLATPAAP